MVVPVRGAGGSGLRMCFGQVTQLAEILRGEGRGATPYAVFRVAEPKRDIETLGCYRAPGAKY